jgi:uncharacterized protein YpbB
VVGFVKRIQMPLYGIFAVLVDSTFITFVLWNQKMPTQHVQSIR